MNGEWIPGVDEVLDELPIKQHRGQVRFALRLAQDHANHLMFAHGIGWHYWDGTRWAVDDRGMAVRAVMDVLRADWATAYGNKWLTADVVACQSAGAIRGILALAANLEQFAVTAADLDADPWLLNCANGTLDLRTWQLRRHDPADRITKVCRAAYHRDARSDEWETFLERILPDKAVRDYMSRFVGVSLCGKILEQTFTIARGIGANGKGVLYGAVLHALGDYGHTAPSDLFMAGQYAHNANSATPALMDLRGRRFVVCSETERDHRLATSLMKNLTGSDPINARALHRDPITFNPSHTVLMVTNYLPKVAGNDPAVWRRMRVVPFDVVIPEAERDPQLGERLELAADAILAWAVNGWFDYRSTGMAAPDAVQAATADYRNRSDAVARFIEERIFVNRYEWVAVADLWAAWEAWAKDDGAEPMTKRDFADEFEKRGWPAKKRKINGHEARGRQGIALIKTEDDDQWAA